MSTGALASGIVVGSAAGLLLGLAGQNAIVIGAVAPAALLTYLWRRHAHQGERAGPAVVQRGAGMVREVTHPEQLEAP